MIYGDAFSEPGGPDRETVEHVLIHSANAANDTTSQTFSLVSYVRGIPGLGNTAEAFRIRGASCSYSISEYFVYGPINRIR